MNINIKSNYDNSDMVNTRLISDKPKNREVDSAVNAIADESRRHEREMIQQATTMDVNEVKDFLFMLIGAEIKVKPENGNSGALINRLA